jgi:hypothetical protein
VGCDGDDILYLLLLEVGGVREFEDWFSQDCLAKQATLKLRRNTLFPLQHALVAQQGAVACFHILWCFVRALSLRKPLERRCSMLQCKLWPKSWFPKQIIFLADLKLHWFAATF